MANYGGSRVTKLRVSDGNAVTYTGMTGAHGVAFDGANIWVTDYDTNQVTRLQPTERQEGLL